MRALLAAALLASAFGQTKVEKSMCVKRCASGCPKYMPSCVSTCRFRCHGGSPGRRLQAGALGATVGEQYGDNKNVTELTTRYQTPNADQLHLAPKYFKAKLCETSIWQEFSALTVSVIIPENPECSNGLIGCVFVEAYNNSAFAGNALAVNYYRTRGGFEFTTQFNMKYIHNEVT